MVWLISCTPKTFSLTKNAKSYRIVRIFLKQNEKFCEIFIIKLKEDENLYRKFHEALLDTDQKHVDNLLEGMVVMKFMNFIYRKLNGNSLNL